MTIALITDSISEKTLMLMKYLSTQHEICVFLPEGTINTEIQFPVRYFTHDFDTAAFQRYDAAVLMADSDWNILIDFVEKIKAAVIISDENEWYDRIASLTEFIISDVSKINELLSSMPEHILWFDRTEREIMSRVKETGLDTPLFMEMYSQIYSYDRRI